MTLIPSAPVEVRMGGKLVPARMFGTSVRDKGKAVFVEIYFPNGRCTLIPWRDVSTHDNVGLHLLGPEVASTKKTEKA
jgi:hypothetical protein